MFVIFVFAYMGEDVALYERAQNLPAKNKLFLVNHPIDVKKYPSFFYVKGFGNQIGKFQNLLGKRYYDQFDFVKWFNSYGTLMERR